MTLVDNFSLAGELNDCALCSDISVRATNLLDQPILELDDTMTNKPRRGKEG